MGEDIPNIQMKKIGDLPLQAVYRRPNDPNRFGQSEFWMKVSITHHMPVQKEHGRVTILEEREKQTPVSRFNPNEEVVLVD